MKNMIKVAMLAVVLLCGAKASAQYMMGSSRPNHMVIDYRRPGMIGFDLGYTWSPMDRTGGNTVIQPNGVSGFNVGLSMDIPISRYLDLVVRVPYYTWNGYKLNEGGYVRLADGSGYVTIKSESSTVHTLTLVAMGMNVYPFRKSFYIGGYFSLGFNFFNRKGYSEENQQGTEYDLDINGFNMHIDMGFETGLNIADKFVVYGRWGLGLYPLTDEEDRGGYNMAAIYPMYLQVGLRIPFFNERM